MLVSFFLGALQAAAPLPTAEASATTEAHAAQPAPFGATAKLEPDQLNAATAREDIGQIAQADQAASVSNNQINGNSTTGTVTISDNAFQNLSGLAVISANSGNNVAINSALNVNVTIRPE